MKRIRSQTLADLSEVISHMPVSGQPGSSSLQDARATFGLPDKSGSSGDRRSLSTDDTDMHRTVGRDAGREFDSVHLAPRPWDRSRHGPFTYRNSGGGGVARATASESSSGSSSIVSSGQYTWKLRAILFVSFPTM